MPNYTRYSMRTTPNQYMSSKWIPGLSYRFASTEFSLPYIHFAQFVADPFAEEVPMDGRSVTKPYLLFATNIANSHEFAYVLKTPQASSTLLIRMC